MQYQVQHERKCKKCGATEHLTIDHIIPKWFAKRAPSFGFKLSFLKERLPANRQYMNIQILCSKCNSEKGGDIDYSDPIAREYLYELIDQIKTRLDEYNPETNLKLFTDTGLTNTPEGVS